MRPALRSQLAVCLWISPIPARCRLLLQFALRIHSLRGYTSLLHQIAAVLQERPTRRAMEAARKALTEACEMDGQLLHVDRSGTLDTKLARWTISAWATCIVAGLALVGSSGGGTTTQ
ncbi:hypothetical protein PLESTB_000049300 [Pleodorina starrii]|uniref:Uncharacterized protein n=1 Tax=Pleodorina starrii TaxID=330485 RepID=A0A9W6B9G1_9CHLO|nr:hypothetical protein PLESTB_000049300 [Pleodorina starrii]